MTNLNEGARTCMVALAFERAKGERGHVTGFEPFAHGNERNEGNEELAKGGWLTRCSRVGTRWTTELADVRAPLYIHIYTSHFDSDALLHPLVVGGELLLAAAAAAASGGGICGSGGGDVDGGGSGGGDAGGCAFFRECSPFVLSDD